MYEPMISFTGNVAFDPKLRTTPTGATVLDLRVGTTPRIRKDDEWVDGGTLWYDVVCWNRLAHNVADSVRKGEAVTVIGRLYNRSWESTDEVTGVITSHDKLTVDALAVGVDLTKQPALVKRPERPRPEEAVPDRRAPGVPEVTDPLAA